jgi:hypothetical protein
MFAYPKQSAFGKLVPKSTVYEYARPTRRVQQCFVDQVSRIVWQHKLSPETTNLPARAGVPEIQIFTIALKTEEVDEDVLRCIDKAISFPIFYELTFEDRMKVMAAYKRPSEADSAKWVVGEYFATDWQTADTVRSPLPVSLDLAGLYEQLLRRLMPLPARNGESLKDHAERLATIRSKEREFDKLEARVNKEKQFNRKVALNTELRKIKSELESLIG